METTTSDIVHNVKVSGDLSNGEEINLINLNIRGDLIITIGYGNINLINIHAKNIIIYESSSSNITNDELGVDILPLETFSEIENIDNILNQNVNFEISKDVSEVVYKKNTLHKLIDKFKNFFN
ncbi:hypothetical protein [Clostridium grantii]|uniref:Uncharacterized protein n=1 Tax=Clostridium grantii DSM 8605 TaxID=1121316 RepID=A0A1M5V6Z9_9CLOT|nr:hypothetical protein [Clostridium grantii]SHH70980.1 hypothetical protein SAMN02745207_02131 [Clostridium grantii DSM 8605]